MIYESKFLRAGANFVNFWSFYANFRHFLLIFGRVDPNAFSEAKKCTGGTI